MQSRFILMLCAAVSFTAPVSAAGLPSQKLLTLDVARTMADAALDRCRSDGFKVTVMVVDNENTLKAFFRDDGAKFGTIEMSRMKAYSTVAFGRASGPPETLAPGAPMPTPLLPGTTYLQGSLPIRVGDQLLGAIAVSGAPAGDKDAACAQAGLEKVTALLN